MIVQVSLLSEALAPSTGLGAKTANLFNLPVARRIQAVPSPLPQPSDRGDLDLLGQAVPQ